MAVPPAGADTSAAGASIDLGGPAESTREASFLALLRPLLDRGLRLRLFAGHVEDGSLNLPESRDELEKWLTAHPRPAVLVRTGFASGIVQVLAVSEQAVARLRDACGPAIEDLTSDGAVASAWFRAPSDRAFFAASHDDGLVLSGENDEVPVGEDGDGLPVADVPVDLPEFPPALAELFGSWAAPIDGTPRFVEMGRAGPSRYWWTTIDALLADPQGHAAGVGAIGTVCIYVAPDEQSARVCRLVIECDHEGDNALDLSILDAKIIVEVLRAAGVPADAIALRFTGNKSLYAIVEAECFGQTPRLDANEVMGRIAQQLFGGKVAFDESIFHRRQKIRVPGTRHGKTGLCCIPVPIQDLATITADELRRRAREPIWPEAEPPGRRVPVPSLVKLWAETVAEIDAAIGRTGGRRAKGTTGDGRRDRSRAQTGKPSASAAVVRRQLRRLKGHPSCITAMVGGKRAAGSRNQLTVAVVAYTRTRGLQELGRRRLFREVAGSLPSERLDVAGRERCLSRAYESATRSRDDTYVLAPRSCQVLRSAGLPCSPACPLLPLWAKQARRSGARRPEPLPPGVEPPAPATIPPGTTLEAILAQARRGIAASVRAPIRGGPIVAVTAPPGVGKTTIVRDEVMKMSAASPGRFRVLWAAARHDLLDATVEKWSGLVHVPARSAETCPRFDDEIGPLVKAGWASLATVRVCLRCPRHPSRRDAMLEPCAYQAAIQDRKASWAVVHELTALTDMPSWFSYVVMDEEFTRACIRKRSYDDRGIGRIADRLDGDPENVARVRRCLRALGSLRRGSERLSRARLREALATLDVRQFVADVDEIDWKTIGPRDDRLGRFTSMSRRSGRAGPSREPSVCPNPRPLLDAVREILRGKAAAVRWTGGGWDVAWIQRPRLGDRPVLLLDATADPMILERLLGRPVEVRRFEVPFVAPVLQVVNAAYSRRTIFAGRAQGGVRPVNRRTVDRLLAAVRARVERVPGRSLLVTYKDLDEGYLKTPEGAALLPSNVDVRHFHGLRGLDLSEYRQLVVLGFPHVSREEVVFRAEALWQGEEPIDERIEEVWVSICATNRWERPDENPVGHDSGPVGVRLPRFVDPRAECVRQSMEDAEFWQTINRHRPINDPTKTTILITSIPIAEEHRVGVRLVDLQDLLPAEQVPAPEPSGVAAACADFLARFMFVSVNGVIEARPDLPKGAVRRAIQRLVRERELPVVVLRRRSGRGGRRIAYGDVEACLQHPSNSDFDVVDEPSVSSDLDSDPATTDEDEGNDFVSSPPVEDGSTGGPDKKSPAADREAGGNPLEDRARPPGAVAGR